MEININKRVSSLTWKDLKGTITESEKTELLKLNNLKSKIIIEKEKPLKNIKTPFINSPEYIKYKKEWGTVALNVENIGGLN